MTPYMVGKLAPNSSHLTKGLINYVPGRGYFRAVSSRNEDKFVTSPPPQSLNGSRKRNTRAPLEHTRDARPRVRTRTGKGSTVQSDGDEVVSGGSGTMSGEQSSNASSCESVITRSDRVPINSVISGGQPIAKKCGRKTLCGLDKCRSTSEWVMSQGAACGDSGAVYSGNEFLCAACHRTGDGNKRWFHLGPSLYAQAIAWVEECRARWSVWKRQTSYTRVLDSDIRQRRYYCEIRPGGPEDGPRDEDLRQQLRAEGYWDRESANTFARATRTASLERIKAVRMGADILEASGLRNVRRGSTLTDDNERHLVPAREYLQQVPKSLRTLMAEVFGLDLGFGCKTERHDDGRTLRKSSEDTRLENKRKNIANRAYFLSTICLNAVLMTNYRAPHEMVLSQAMKSVSVPCSVSASLKGGVMTARRLCCVTASITSLYRGMHRWLWRPWTTMILNPRSTRWGKIMCYSAPHAASAAEMRRRVYAPNQNGWACRASVWIWLSEPNRVMTAVGCSRHGANSCFKVTTCAVIPARIIKTRRVWR